MMFLEDPFTLVMVYTAPLVIALEWNQLLKSPQGGPFENSHIGPCKSEDMF